MKLCKIIWLNPFNSITKDGRDHHLPIAECCVDVGARYYGQSFLCYGRIRIISDVLPGKIDTSNNGYGWYSRNFLSAETNSFIWGLSRFCTEQWSPQHPATPFPNHHECMPACINIEGVPDRFKGGSYLLCNDAHSCPLTAINEPSFAISNYSYRPFSKSNL